MVREAWAAGAAYEAYVGRWSAGVAAAFVDWLAVPAGRWWLDVGCGTGSVSAAVLARADPARVLGVDTSAGFVAAARGRLAGPRAAFCVADARALPVRDRQVDAVVSGLALNFVPDLPGAVAEIARATSPGGVAAAYVWDYADGMEMIRYFWDAAVSLDPAAGQLDEGPRFPVCQPGPLRGVWETAGFGEVTVRPIEVPTVFTGFGDFWEPFLGGQGPAPGYVSSLVPKDRRALEHLLRGRLPAGPDGTIPLRARAWAVRGRA